AGVLWAIWSKWYRQHSRRKLASAVEGMRVAMLNPFVNLTGSIPEWSADTAAFLPKGQSNGQFSYDPDLAWQRLCVRRRRVPWSVPNAACLARQGESRKEPRRRERTAQEAIRDRRTPSGGVGNARRQNVWKALTLPPPRQKRRNYFANSNRVVL